jgi:uncharacterized protein (TIGR00730 family)
LNQKNEEDKSMITISVSPAETKTLTVKAPTPTKTVCVYCGSGLGADPKYAAVTRELGQKMVDNAMRLVYGGGHIGLMGVIADAVLDAGGQAVGIIPEHIHIRENQHNGLSELLVVDSMHTRKRLMADRAEAYIVLPGGFGTLDEAFEIITWKQLELHNSPIIFLNVDGFWDPLVALVRHQTEAGFIHAHNQHLFQTADTVDEAISILRMMETDETMAVVPDVR